MRGNSGSKQQQHGKKSALRKQAFIEQAEVVHGNHLERQKICAHMLPQQRAKKFCNDFRTHPQAV